MVRKLSGIDDEDPDEVVETKREAAPYDTRARYLYARVTRAAAKQLASFFAQP